MEKGMLEGFNKLSKAKKKFRNVCMIFIYVSAAIIGVSGAIYVTSKTIKEIQEK